MSSSGLSPDPGLSSDVAPAESPRVRVIGAPPDEVSLKKHKNAWKKLLSEQKGKPPFDYSHNGVTLQLVVLNDGQLHCGTIGCLQCEFGRTPYTRGEANAQKHADACHRFQSTAGTAKPSAVAPPPAVKLVQACLAPPKPRVQGLPQPRTDAPSTALPTLDDEMCPADPPTDPMVIEEEGAGQSSQRFMLQRLPSLADRLDKESQEAQKLKAEELRRVGLERSTPPARLERLTPSAPPFDWVTQFCAVTAPRLAHALLTKTTIRSDAVMSSDASASQAVTNQASAAGDGDVALGAAAAGDALRDALQSLDLQPCPGYALDIPEPAIDNYPHGYHLIHPTHPWWFDSRAGVVRASTCARIVSGNDACNNCALLSKEDNLTQLQERAWDENLFKDGTKDNYLTLSQLRARKNAQRLQGRKTQLVLLGRNQSLARLTRVLEQHKQLLVFLAQQKIPRVHAVLARAMKSGMSITATLELLIKAKAGLYHARGFSEEELDEGILTLRLGGRKLCYALHHGSSGAVGESTVRSIASLPRYISCAIEIDINIIRGNFERHLFSRPWEAGRPRVLHQLMMDDVKGSKRARVSDADGCIRGICFHGLGVIDSKLTSYAQAELLATKLSAGEIHHGTEITNVAIAANAEKGYKPIVVATSAGCTSNDPMDRTKQLIHFTLKIWNEDPRGCELRGPISTLQPDGASTMVKATHRMFFVNQMHQDHPLHDQLRHLKLFNTHVGADANYSKSTAGCEQKHTGKRVRERAKSEIGMCVGAINGLKLTGSLWRNLMTEARGELGISVTDIHKMFATGFADAQRVAPMILFFRTVAKMGSMAADAFGQMSIAFANAHKDIRLFSRFADLLTILLADKRPSLTEHTCNVSELAHIVFVIFRRHRTNFVPSQNYRNQQAMYRSIYWSIGTAKVEDILEYFIFMDSGDALENVYNIVRSMFSGEAMDVLQFEERIGAAMQVDAVFERQPHLLKEARHLATTEVRGSDDHNNPRSFLSCAGGGEDRRRVAVAPVSLLTCWNLGAERAAAALVRDGLYSAAEVDWVAIAANEPGVDMLRPLGDWVGVSVPDDDVAQPEAPQLDAAAAEEADAAAAFEDALPVVPVTTQLVSTQVRYTPCKIDGVPGCCGAVVPSKALRIAMDGLSRKSESSRIARSENKEKSGEEVKLVSLEAPADEVLFADSCPIMVLVLVTGFGVTPAVVLPESFSFHKAGNKVCSASISTEVFNVPGSLATGHVMMLKPTGTKLQWRSGSYGPRVTVECVHAVALNPEVDIVSAAEKHGALTTLYTFDVSNTSDAAACLWAEVQPSQPKLVKLAAEGCLPYHTHVGGDPKLGTAIAFNLAGGAEALATASSAAAAAATTRLVKCAIEGCDAEVPAKEMLQHVAWHVKVRSESVSHLTMPCGLCGAYEQMQYSASPGDSPGCPAWLENDDVKRKATIPRTVCKVVGEVSYRQADAMKSTKSCPGTNHLVACPMCPAKPMKQYFWSYNMMKHWERTHKSQQMPAELLKEITICEVELEGLQEV